MESIREYLLCITAAAIVCSITVGLMGKKGAYGALIKLLTGLFLTVTVISPWTKLDLADISAYTEGLSIDAGDAVAHGESVANEATAAIIKSQTEAYILDKAASMDLDIEVEVTLSSEAPPVPATVSVTGEVSPYAKERLRQCIANDLGIPEENQSWN